MLVDDLSRNDGKSALGTEWQSFTDRVMGGVSTGRATRENLDGRPCILLRGDVSLANNGGFIQVALPLASRGGVLDAREYSGVRLTARGNGEDYYVHLRTSDTGLPWQYYQARFATGGDWQEVEIPFKAFVPENLRAPLDPGKLKRLGIVAAKKAMSAEVAVAHIAFYR